MLLWGALVQELLVILLNPYFSGILAGIISHMQVCALLVVPLFVPPPR